MNIIQVFGIIFITASFCFIIFQLWYYAENYTYILKYNNAYSNLQFARSANINYQDRTVNDPNDNEFNVDRKWRCAEENGIYYPVSSFGFMSTESTGINLTYTFIKDCILELFNTQLRIVYNACSISGSLDCQLLNRLLANNS
ncbi:membrane protein [Alphaentomopoxvirus acuprea]|uniref:Membrane protein n=1 Tax=Alphaentomopoxvirus acuprea TaxID=62099 RepID=W6JLC6_9POXV|nr:membrane protein [Anomala cuprea entomopoxvirus]BAO49431.1 membrane protein [Anomala cuprea entomopoxvirus]